MTADELVGGLIDISTAYKRNANPRAAARARTIEEAAKYIQETEQRIRAIERGTKCLLLRAAEQVGEAQQQVVVRVKRC